MCEAESPGQARASHDTNADANGAGACNFTSGGPHDGRNDDWRDLHGDGVSDYPEPLTEDEQQVLDRLIELGCTVWVGKRPWWKTDQEFIRPDGWQGLHNKDNERRLRDFEKGRCSVCLNTGGVVAVVDADPRNGCDVEKVRAKLAELGETVYAEVRTPSGGTHFYIAGHEDLPTVHSTEKNQKLPGFPGLDLQSFGANVFGPGTLRAKYSDAGYEIVFDDLDKLAELDGDGGTGALADWVAEQVAVGIRAKARRTAAGARDWEWDPCEPWDGTPPDARQRGYLDAALAGEAEKVVRAAVGGRNEALFTAALKLGSYVSGAGCDEQQVIAALEGAAERNGSTAEDGVMATQATIRSGLRRGKRNPRAVPEADTIDTRTGVGSWERAGAGRDDFWEATAELRHVRDFARARRVGLWAMLGIALARVVCMVPPTVRIPAYVGRTGSLNLYVGLVGFRS